MWKLKQILQEGAEQGRRTAGNKGNLHSAGDEAECIPKLVFLAAGGDLRPKQNNKGGARGPMAPVCENGGGAIHDGWQRGLEDSTMGLSVLRNKREKEDCDERAEGLENE